MRVLDLELQAPSLDAMRTFYAGVLGLPTLEDSAERLVLDVGNGATLTFTPAPGGTAPRYHYALLAPCNLGRDARAWLAERTEVIETTYSRDWDADGHYYLDPAGSIGELISHRRLRNAARPPFGANRLLGIAEVGLPVADVEAALEELGSELGIGRWAPGDSDTFVPTGAPEGGFIVVPDGRGWYPTGQPAEAAHRLVVTVAAEGGREVALAHAPCTLRRRSP